MNSNMEHKTNKIPDNKGTFEAILQVVETLRGPNGCPWDKEQTHLSLTQYAIEEIFELTEAIELNNDQFMKEELGDVLFQVILHSQLANERGAFSITDVIHTLVEKMIRRHPHVFESLTVNSTQEIINNWEQIKKAEKETMPENLDKSNGTPEKSRKNSFGLPVNLPALQTSYKIGKKTEKAGFVWATAEDVIAKVLEELDEVRAEIKPNLQDQNQSRIEEEMGDLLFSVSQLARHLQVEPETCLRKANKKFEDRYFKMLALATEKDLDFMKLTLEEKESLWQAIKRK